jgi:hypothetical protein
MTLDVFTESFHRQVEIHTFDEPTIFVGLMIEDKSSFLENFSTSGVIVALS